MKQDRTVRVEGKPSTYLRNAVIGLGIAAFISALTSENPFHPDEQMQILDFAGYKIGTVARDLMPWEFAAEIRPWFMPWVATGARHIVHAVGSSDPGYAATILRMLAATLSVFGLVQLAKIWQRLQSADPTKSPDSTPGYCVRAQLWFVCTAAFIPYLSVRFSSEGMSASFFIFGLERATARVGASANSQNVGHSKRAVAPLLAGLLWALAFACRYQAAIMIAGAFIWCALYARTRVSELALIFVGFLAGALGNVAIDSWGYGHLAFPAIGYVRANLLEGVAAAFSTEPAYAYLYLPLANIFAVAAVATLLSVFVFWLRFPSHLMTWVTAPSFVLFSFLGHKEERFLFPLAMLGAFMVVPAWQASQPGTSVLMRAFAAINSWVRRLATSGVGKALWAVNLLALVAACIYPFHWREHIPLARQIYVHVPAGAVLHLDNAGTTGYPSYRRPWQQREWHSGCPVAVGEFVLAQNADPQLDLELIYSEWPLGHSLLGMKRDAEDGSVRWRARVGDVVQRLQWASLYRVRAASGGGPICAAIPHVPMATKAPNAR